MPVISVHGVDLHYEDTGGDGEPVLFLHGFLFDGRQFDAQVRVLSPAYRCLTLDFRGQGRSAVAKGGYQIEQQTADVLAVIRELGIAPVHLAGLSMGGFAAMRIAARQPGLVRSLTLLNTSAGPQAPGKLPSLLGLTAIGRTAGLSMSVLVARVERELYGGPFRTDPGRAEERQAWRRRWARADRAALAKTMLGIMARPDIRAELADITVPTLVIAGEQDRSLPPPDSRQIHAHIPGSRLVEVPRAGHSSPIEEPAAVTEAITRFLADQRG